MKNSITCIRCLSLIILVALLTGCAVSYHTIRPEKLNYMSSNESDGVRVAYKYDVLAYSQKKRYEKKERKNGIRLLAVQITNNTDSTLVPSRDCLLYAGDRQLLPLEPSVTARKLSQKTGLYSLYLLLTLVKLDYYVSTPTTYMTGSLPIGLALGPGITALNMLKSASSNQRVRTNLMEYDIWNQSIGTGQTVSGLVAITCDEVVPIQLRLKQ